MTDNYNIIEINENNNIEIENIINIINSINLIEKKINDKIFVCIDKLEKFNLLYDENLLLLKTISMNLLNKN